MKQVKLFLIAAVAALSCTAAVAQSDPRILISVSPAPGSDAVTLSRAATKNNDLQLDTFAAFQVSVTNGARSALNRVFFDGTAISDGTDFAVWDSFIATNTGDTCTGVGNTVSCSLASLAPGASTSFTVIFMTPRTGTTLNLSWTGGGDEGNGGGNGCCNQTGTSTAPISLIDPSTNDLFKSQASTFMRPKGFTLFTGPQAVTSSSDGWSTIITVPQFTATTYTKASIVETNPQTSCQPYVVGAGCFVSDVTIPGFAVPLPAAPIDPTKLLQITIRLDKAYFNFGKAKPETAKLYYFATDTTPLPGYELKLCSAAAPPTADQPCFAVPPKVLKNSDTSDKELAGDLEFRVWALRNGRYAN